MSGRVLFAITEGQAAALRAIERTGKIPGRLDRWHTRREGVLLDRGLVAGGAGGRRLVLTPLGELALAICDKLASPAAVLASASIDGLGGAGQRKPS